MKSENTFLKKRQTAFRIVVDNFHLHFLKIDFLNASCMNEENVGNVVKKSAGNSECIFYRHYLFSCSTVGIEMGIGIYQKMEQFRAVNKITKQIM